MSPLVILCLFSAACERGPQPPPLPVWHDAYKADLTKIPGDATAFLNASYSELVLVIRDNAGGTTIKNASLNKDVRPNVQTLVLPVAGGEYAYTYTVRNDATARDPILRFRVVVPANFDSTFALINNEVGPKEWSGGIGLLAVAPQCELLTDVLGRYAHWVGSSGLRYAISPGRSRSGLGLKTTFRPGITTAYIGGPFVSIPEEYGADLEITADPVWSMVHIPVIGPMFPSTASCNDILTNYRQGLTRLLQCGVPDPDKKAVSEMLAQIDAASSSCSELVRKINTRRPQGNGIASEAQNALSLALKPFLKINAKDVQ